MKDLTLSEQKAICMKYALVGCRKCEIRDFCHNVRFKRPFAYDDIEPRDMIELPCIQKNKWESDDESLNFATYDLIYRDKYGHIQVIHDFFDEAGAYAFLAQMKGEKA